MPAPGFSQKEAAAPSVIPLQLTKIRRNSWKFQPQMPLVFAFHIVYLPCISLPHSSQGTATGAKGRQKKIPISGAKSERCKGHGGICHGQRSQRSPLGASCPPRLLSAVRHAESSSWLWMVITAASGTSAPVEGQEG